MIKPLDQPFRMTKILLGSLSILGVKVHFSATLGVKVILVSFTNDKNVMTLGIKYF